MIQMELSIDGFAAVNRWFDERRKTARCWLVLATRRDAQIVARVLGAAGWSREPGGWFRGLGMLVVKVADQGPDSFMGGQVDAAFVTCDLPADVHQEVERRIR